jgi:hypothetical protein
MSKARTFIVAGLLAVLAMFAQGAALAQLLHPVRGVDPLLLFFVLQALAGLAEAGVFHAFLPARYREPRAWSLLLLWLMCTFVPFGGGLIVLASCLWAACFPGAKESGLLGDVARPEFVTWLVSRVSHGGGARLQARLANTQVPATDRLSALVAIQGMPTRTTGTLLRELLADPLEDVRLIAYGTLDHAENEIMQKIFHTGKALDVAAGDGERHALNRRLAELHFELVYQNLVQGAVYRHTLEQADRYARAALATDDSDAALWLIRGRLALADGKPEEGQACMSRAQALGFPRERLVPWLAEVAFLNGDYAQVAALLASLGNAAVLPTLKPVVSYWS